jgi:hypothetical protein
VLRRHVPAVALRVCPAIAGAERRTTVAGAGLIAAAAAGALGFSLATGAFFGGLAFGRGSGFGPTAARPVGPYPSPARIAAPT